MTCIVGYLDKDTNTVSIGADSAGVSGLDITIRKDEKVFKNGDFIIGCTSSFRMIQLLRYTLKPPKVKTKDISKYMCTQFINAVRKCFKDGGYLTTSNGNEEGGTFLVGYKDRLFEINSDFQVGEPLDNCAAVGCGSNFALGALFHLRNEDLTPKEKVLKALDAAEYYSGGVSKPFIVKTIK